MFLRLNLFLPEPFLCLSLFLLGQYLCLRVKPCRGDPPFPDPIHADLGGVWFACGFEYATSDLRLRFVFWERGFKSGPPVAPLLVKPYRNR